MVISILTLVAVLYTDPLDYVAIWHRLYLGLADVREAGRVQIHVSFPDVCIVDTFPAQACGLPLTWRARGGGGRNEKYLQHYTYLGEAAGPTNRNIYPAPQPPNLMFSTARTHMHSRTRARARVFSEIFFRIPFVFFASLFLLILSSSPVPVPVPPPLQYQNGAGVGYYDGRHQLDCE